MVISKINYTRKILIPESPSKIYYAARIISTYPSGRGQPGESEDGSGYAQEAGPVG